MKRGSATFNNIYGRRSIELPHTLMSDKTIKTAANITLALVTAATLIFILKAFDLSPTRLFWEVLASVMLAEAAVAAAAAWLLPRYLAHIRRPRMKMTALYGFRLSRAEDGHPRGTLRLGIRNQGDTTLDRYRWHLFVPKALRPEITTREGDRTVNIGTRVIGGYEYATGYIGNDPLLPKTTKELPFAVRLESNRSDVTEWTMRYAISTEFGQFPTEAERHESLDASTIPDCAPLVLKVG